MPAVAIIGAQWGDEGKGKVTDHLTAQADVVVRYQGGANAGHTVWIGTERFALHMVPTGLLRPGCLAIVGNGTVLEPERLVRELDELEARGVDLSLLRISDRAHVVLPAHRLQDRLEEEARLEARIGTTGLGIGPAYVDKAARTGLRMGDLLAADLEARLTPILERKRRQLEAAYGFQATDAPELDPAAVAARFSAAAQRLAPFVTDTAAILHQAAAEGRRILLEGAQGTLLDLDHGTYPFVTSSSSSAGGSLTGSGLGPRAITRLIGVAKAYTTRVGEGPFPTELRDATGDWLRERGQEFGTTTGRPRRCGWLDLVAVRYSVQVNGLTDLALTKLDALSGLERLRVCTAYRVDSGLLDRPPARSDLMERAEPVYEEHPGWTEDLSKCRSFDQLPPAAQAYVQRIEAVAGCPVSLLSLGPERSQTVVRSTDLWQG
ncbi:adenylosuccinate synthase [Limnochorda pilosa]|uniref:Adenylosuccinate synthetase n=1 Tax=Limnochorda pilosa TaxID=1555112 RepID=A0A0K2SQ89_LIMPI|nr:adenylosuccinate synthase [Limnochorda pilosa]BAS28999.1 adenylosuccinate synthetase [Limnochorda pilosa]